MLAWATSQALPAKVRLIFKSIGNIFGILSKSSVILCINQVALITSVLPFNLNSDIKKSVTQKVTLFFYSKERLVHVPYIATPHSVPLGQRTRGCDGRQEGCESGYYHLHRYLNNSIRLHNFHFSKFKVLRPKGQSDQGRLQSSKFKVQSSKFIA